VRILKGQIDLISGTMLKCGHAWMTHRSIVSFQARITWFPKERHPLWSSGKVIHSAKWHDHRPGRSGVMGGFQRHQPRLFLSDIFQTQKERVVC